MSDINQVGGSAEVQHAPAPGVGGRRGANPAARMHQQTGVGNLNQLKQKSPEVWNMTLKAMASQMCNDWQKFPDRLKKIRQESERH